MKLRKEEESTILRLMKASHYGADNGQTKKNLTAIRMQEITAKADEVTAGRPRICL